MSIRFSKNQQILDTEACEINLNILAHAQLIELDIGSICGGHGHCGKDRILIQVKDQTHLSPITEKERKFLTQDELSKGYRLACQCYPEKENLNILCNIK